MSNILLIFFQSFLRGARFYKSEKKIFHELSACENNNIAKKS